MYPQIPPGGLDWMTMKIQFLKLICSIGLMLAAFGCRGMDVEKPVAESIREPTVIHVTPELEQSRLASIVFGNSWRVLEMRIGDTDIPSLFTVSSVVMNTSGFCRRDQMAIDSRARNIEEVSADDLINAEVRHYFAFGKQQGFDADTCKNRFPEFFSSLDVQKSVDHMRWFQDYLSDTGNVVEFALDANGKKATVSRDYLFSNIDSLSYTLDTDGGEFGVFTIRLDQAGSKGKELLVSIKQQDHKIVRLLVQDESLPAL